MSKSYLIKNGVLTICSLAILYMGLNDIMPKVIVIVLLIILFILSIILNLKKR